MAAYVAKWSGEERNQWSQDVSTQRAKMMGQNYGMTDFYVDTMATILGEDTGKNRVFSPLSLYLAMGMMAETTGGNSRQQILDLLRVEDMDALRVKCTGLWNGVFIDDTASICRLSNSLWLCNDLRYGEYNIETVERLAQQYYATVYRGEMGSEEYNAALRGWLNDRTGGLLKGPAENIKLPQNTVAALVNAIQFGMKWNHKFTDTYDGAFYTDQGAVTVPFMYWYDKYVKLTTSYGDQFTAVKLPMDGGGSAGNGYAMTIFLPAEGVTPEVLLQDPQALGLLENTSQKPKATQSQAVILQIPKFDITSDTDLKEKLKLLGVTDVFDENLADASGIFSQIAGPVALDKVQHAVRVKIDEEGCEAAAYTVLNTTRKGINTDQPLDFTVDRPFMFAVTGPGNTILFAGIVENPK